MLRSNLLEAISVKMRRWDSNTEGVLVARDPETLVSKGGQILSMRGGFVAAANRDYSFSASIGNEQAVNYLEGGKTGSRESDVVRRYKESVILLTTHFNQQPLIDIFRSPKFKLINIDNQGEQIEIKSEYTDPSGWLNSPLIFRLDSSNFYQLLSIRGTMHRENAVGASYDFIYEYYTTPFGDLPVRLLKKFTSNIQSKKNDGKSSETQILEFSDWKRPSIDDSSFYLSAYGFDEPDVDALNQRPNWLRLTAAIAVLIASLVLIFWKFGKR